MSLSAGRAAELLDADRLVGLLRDLVRIDSQNPPGREADAADAADGVCRALGLETARFEAAPGRPNLVARLERGEGPVISFCSHLDTVPVGDRSIWRHDPLAADVEAGRMWGRGTCDAKGAIAAALEAVAILGEAGAELRGTLELELVSDEETMGALGAAFLIEQGHVAPDAVVVGEPTSLRLVRAQRGACWVEVVTRGVAAHGSAPERGVNAILHMVEVLRRLESSLPGVSHDVLGGPSINVGTVLGGEKVNMVPGLCRAQIDRRTVPGETGEEVLAQIRRAIDDARAEVPDLDADVRVLFDARPFEVDEDARVVREVSGALADATGRPAELVGFRGASDARFFAEAGSEVVVCGPGDIAVAHTIEESIDLAELERAAIVYALAFARLLA
ncbi:MAG TPA: M20 family metallopeptidase [Actinomycetota bacterium]|nr:M20 family metallopeptidase [Actinomycetota bacterium]